MLALMVCLGLTQGQHGYGATRFLRILPSEASVLGAMPTAPVQGSIRILPLPLADGGLLAVSGTANGPQGIWRISNSDSSMVSTPSPTWGGPRILGGAVTPDGDVYLGTTGGLLQYKDGKTIRCERFRSLGMMSMVTSPEVLAWPVPSLVADGLGNLWLTDTFPGHHVFPTRRKYWVPYDSGQGDRELLPMAHIWDTPCMAIAGDRKASGLWTYGRWSDGSPRLFHIRWEPTSETFPRVVLPEELTGEPLPLLNDALMDVDEQGRIWLAGTSEARPKVVLVEGNSVSDITPSDNLIGRSQIRAMTTGSDVDDLLVATDRNGVLTLHRTEWSVHRVTNQIPDFGGRRADAVAVDANGGIWVGSGAIIIHWTAE